MALVVGSAGCALVARWLRHTAAVADEVELTEALLAPQAADAATLPAGPPGWANWRAQRDGRPALATFEFALYTDAHVTGHAPAGLGPYALLNTGPDRHPADQPARSIVLRAEQYVENALPGVPTKTDVSAWYGGTEDDELAALVSLALGVRCRSGGLVRVFGGSLGGDDPRGRPLEGFHHRPFLPPVRTRVPVLPHAARTVLLDDAVTLLARYPDLPAGDAVALVRAARAYRQALWVAEDDPDLAWLELVGAAEAVASRWDAGEDAPADRLRSANRRLAEVLEAEGGQAHLEAVAELIAHQFRATAKFVNFLLAFLPQPREPRPRWFQTEWSPTEMKKHLRRIYDWRSQRLHGGVPFPAPMCRRPFHDAEDHGGGYAEAPEGTAYGTAGTAWLLDDTPMLLHTFEYIVGEALRAWWVGQPS